MSRPVAAHRVDHHRFEGYLAPALITVAAALLRAWDLGGVPLRWDEGWSIAHASLPLADIVRITGQDVHPPLYYMALGLWQTLAGASPFATRWLSVLTATSAIPLIFCAARALSGSRQTALLAMLLMSWLPLAVYYGGVTRMYAFVASFIALALYGGLRIERRRGVIAFLAGACGAMLTLYHAAWALIALGLWLLIARRVQMRRLSLAIGAALLIYAPWAVYGIPRLFGRAAAEATTNTNQQRALTELLATGLRDLTFSHGTDDVGLGVVAAFLLVGLIAIAVRRDWRALGHLTLPHSMIALTLLGVAIAARQWAFNARMLIAATPALALALAWSIDQLARWVSQRAADTGAQRRAYAITAISASLLLLSPFREVSLRAVYQKSLEVFDDYSATTYRDELRQRSRPGDLVFFNVLSPAGFFESQRVADDADWSYALTWDPVKEPRADYEARIGAAARQHDRLWIVLYRGLAPQSNNGDLRGFMDSTYFPAYSRWGPEEVYYGLYGATAPNAPGATARWGNIALSASRIGGATPGAIAPVRLTWRLSAPESRALKVFVHLTRADGFAVSQHDCAPLNDLRPFASLPLQEDVIDHHGLVIPPGEAGMLRIRVGLYDAATGQRVLTDDGADAVELGVIKVR
jgi:hypothetical protein